jgi:proliferating cell nuclear antigen
MTKIFELKTIKSGVIKYMVELLKEILVEGNLILDETGIKITAIDPSQTIILHMKLDAEKFEYFHCPERTVIGVHIMHLYKICKTITNNQILTMYIEDTSPNILMINIFDEDEKDVNSFDLQLMDLDVDDLEIPDLEYNVELTLPTQHFQKKCRDMSQWSDKMEIRFENAVVTFRGNNDYIGHRNSLKIDNTSEEMHISNNLPGTIIQGYFNLKHLVTFTKCANLCNKIVFYMTNDKPLLVSYDVGDLGNIKLGLSPSV